LLYNACNVPHWYTVQVSPDSYRDNDDDQRTNVCNISFTTSINRFLLRRNDKTKNHRFLYRWFQFMFVLIQTIL